jgi:hypoxanthine phosphoribosyltransferase
MSADPLRILIPREEIAGRVSELGKEIGNRFAGNELCLMPVMDGGMIFAADLMREITLPLVVLPVKASSYGDGTSSSGNVLLPCGVPDDLRGRKILLIDDILDTGRTLEVLGERLLAKGAESVQTCVLLRKESASNLRADFIGFDIPDHFVVGYGLDLAGLHRNLPDIMIHPDTP